MRSFKRLSASLWLTARLDWAAWCYGVSVEFFAVEYDDRLTIAGPPPTSHPPSLPTILALANHALNRTQANFPRSIRDDVCHVNPIFSVVGLCFSAQCQATSLRGRFTAPKLTSKLVLDGDRSPGGNQADPVGGCLPVWIVSIRHGFYRCHQKPITVTAPHLLILKT